MYDSGAMARRSAGPKDDPLTREELNTLAKRLRISDTASLEAFYRSAHHRCSLQPRWTPSAKAVQELVQAWKALRQRQR